MNAFVRKTLIVIVVMALVAVSGWAGRKIYHKATMNRLVAEAGGYLEKQDLKQASLCLRQAMSINPLDVKANKMMADMLEEAGSPAALGWRIRAVQLQTNNVEFRFDWARTALKVNEPASAAQALRGVDEKYRSTAEYHKLLGALAWDMHSAREAEKEYSEALRLEPTNQVVTLNLATVRLVSTNAAEVAAARLTLEQVPTNSPLHLTSLRYLTTDAMNHKAFDRALFFSQEVVRDPKVAYADKLTHLRVLEADKNGSFDGWLASLKEEAAHSAPHAYVLAHWLQSDKSPTVALRWLQSLPTELQTNMPVPLAITDCQIALKDWPGILTVVQKQDWEDLNYYRLCLEALANRNAGETLAEKSAWRRAFLMSSSHLDRLSKLNQLTAGWGWTDERNEVLQEISSSFPKETWAGDELVAQCYADGKTHALADVLAKLYAANPTNMRLKNNLATVLMLLKAEPDKAHRLALESYSSSTNNPFFACTYAYSLLLQSKPDEALKVISTLSTNNLKIPAIAAYYGVVEAETGHKNVAKEPLQLALSARLLPEELDLVRKAETRL
jgi:Tfp pilus assembly protein PilF